MAEHDLGDMQQLQLNLQQWLQRKLPAIPHLKLQALDFPQAGGESSVSLIVKGESELGPHSWVCRMCPPRSEVFDAHDLPLQFELMRRLGEAGVPVPSLVALESDPTVLGGEFYVMDFIAGKIPPDRPPFAFGSWVTDLDADQRASMWAAGLQTLATIHTIPLDKLADTNLPRSQPDEPPMQHELNKFVAMADGLEAELDPRLREALDYAVMHLPATGERGLCWGDARVGNIIWQDLAPAAVIDWEMASLGDPLADVSWWYWIDYMNSVGLGAERPTGLPELESLYCDWHERTGLSLEHRRFYDLFAVLRYAIVLEKKFAAMEAAGMGRFDNFTVRHVSALLEAAAKA